MRLKKYNFPKSPLQKYQNPKSFKNLLDRTWRSRWSQVQDLSGLPCWGGHELCWQYRSRLLLMLLVLMSSWCWSWFLPGWGGHEPCWQYRSRILRSFFKMLILIIDYCLMRLWTVLTIQVRVIVHDADADVFINNDNNDIMLIMFLIGTA